jgi:hypothetical protein
LAGAGSVRLLDCLNKRKFKMGRRTFGEYHCYKRTDELSSSWRLESTNAMVDRFVRSGVLYY